MSDIDNYPEIEGTDMTEPDIQQDAQPAWNGIPIVGTWVAVDPTDDEPGLIVALLADGTMRYGLSAAGGAEGDV